MLLSKTNTNQLKISHFFTLIILSSLIFACGEDAIEDYISQEDCFDIEVGFFSLEEATVNYVDYQLYDTVIYKNETGEEKKWVAKGYSTRDVDIVLEHFNCDLNPAVKYYTRQHKQILFRAAGGIDFDYYWNNRNLGTVDTFDFCDIFSVVFRSDQGNESCGGGIILNCIDKDPMQVFEQVNFTPAEVLGAIEINGELYEEVFQLVNCGLEIWFVAEIGIVKFVDVDDETWYFDRVLRY